MSNKYTKPIIIIIAITIFLPIGLLVGMRNEEGILNLIPGSMGLHAALLIWMIPLFAILGALMGYLTAPLFLFLHKTFIGRKQRYGIDVRPKDEEKQIKKKHKKKFEYTFRGFFPALMGMNFALSFVFNAALTSLLLADINIQTGYPIAMLFVMISVTNGIAFALFSGVWFLTDAGLVYTNREKVRGKNEPIEVKSVGGWFQNILKGYAGISVILSFITFVGIMFELYGSQLHFSMVMFLVPFPILIALWSLPAVLILDKTQKKRKKYVLKFAKKLDIMEIIDIDIKTP